MRAYKNQALKPFKALEGETKLLMPCKALKNSLKPYVLSLIEARPRKALEGPAK